ncbi:MAG: secretin N-terminal domain-containing protein [Burkholderiales bacterium]
MHRCRYGWLILLWSAAVLAAGLEVSVLSLHYRSAEEVIPLLRPLLDGQSVVTGMNNRLVVKATPQQLHEIKEVLRAIDVRPRQLVISVRQASSAELEEEALSVGVRTKAGRNAEVVVGDAPKREGVRVRARNARSTNADRAEQTVRVMEGRAALIQVGEAAPVRTQTLTQTPNGQRITRSTQYQTAARGFRVTPRITGDRVTLEIVAADDRFNEGGSTNVQRVATTASGTLGQWIEIGGIGEESQEEHSVILGSSKQIRRDRKRVLLKVEEVYDSNMDK